MEILKNIKIPVPRAFEQLTRKEKISTETTPTTKLLVTITVFCRKSVLNAVLLLIKM